jgi:hypothetical protein
MMETLCEPHVLRPNIAVHVISASTRLGQAIQTALFMHCPGLHALTEAMARDS